MTDLFYSNPESLASRASVARLDLCVFADSHDVKPSQINVKFCEDYDSRLHLLSEALKWAWSGTVDVVFTPEAEDLLLSSATDLYNTFAREPV